MVINGRTLDAAKVAAHDRGVKSVSFGNCLRGAAEKIHPADDTGDEHQDRSRDPCEFAHDCIDASGRRRFMAALFPDVADHFFADSIQCIFLRRSKHHEKFLGMIGKFAFAGKTDADMVSFVSSSSLDKPVQHRALLDHAEHGGQRTVEDGGFIFRMRRIFLFQIAEQFCGVYGVEHTFAKRTQK